MLILDLLYFVDFLFLISALGMLIPVSNRKYKDRFYVPFMGLAITAFVATVSYTTLHMPLTITWVILHIVALLTLLWKRRFDHWPLQTWSYLLAVFLLLMLPKWILGANYAVFQGNQWDHFGYFQSAVIYLTKSYSFLQNLTTKDVLQNSLYLIAKDNLNVRPSVHILFALSGAFKPLLLYKLSYTFLATLFSFSALVVSRLCCKLELQKRSVLLPYLVGVVFVVGFWGQYIFDINAWSEIAALPFILLIVGELLCFEEISYFRLSAWGVATLYLYPEILLFYSPALLLVAILLRKSIGKKVLLAAITVVASGLFYLDGTLAFVFKQARYGVGGGSFFWTYFQKFFFGKGDLVLELKAKADSYLLAMSPLDKGAAVAKVNWFWFFKNFFLSDASGILIIFFIVVNILAAFSGHYFLTPMRGISFSLTTLWSLLLLFYLAALYFFALSYLWKSLLRPKYLKYNDSSDSKEKRFYLTLIIFISLAAIAVLVLKQQFWSAGKALTFVSPLLLIVIVLSLADKGGLKKVLLVIFMLHQLSLAPWRILSGLSNDFVANVPYAGNSYPAILKDAIQSKTHYSFAIDETLAKIHTHGCDLVILQIKELWAREYWKSVLSLTPQVHFYSGGRKVMSYFDKGDFLGYEELPRKLPFYRPCTLADDLTLSFGSVK
ncbi:MAG: hypothetical protein HQK50_12115 [Oligoflexia bacterium]|nr:hypothetical protein [Oligoflexia bacterium]MBF0366310.1 hypothetical protein [Oligoflexia bacterium]